MPITRRTDYAVRLMYELSQLPDGASLSMRDLSDAADIPESFGAPLAAYLIDAGMVKASGYREHQLSLARPAAEITMAEVVRACEPRFSLAQCTQDPDTCSRSRHCGVHRMWIDLDAIVWAQLESITLAAVASDRACGPTDTLVPLFAGLPGTA